MTTNDKARERRLLTVEEAGRSGTWASKYQAQSEIESKKRGLSALDTRAQGLTDDQTAEALGVSATTVRRMRKGDPERGIPPRLPSFNIGLGNRGVRIPRWAVEMVLRGEDPMQVEGLERQAQ